MDTSALTRPKEATAWRAIWGLAALEGTITIGWLAYEKYQPVLLERFQFTALASLLIVAQGIIGALFHPISGKLADWLVRKRGSQFPLIISGIAFAAIIFMAVSLSIFTNAQESFRWVLPVLVLLWLAAMSTFHSPAISLIDTFTPVKKFPKVAAILSMVFGFVYTLEPFVIPLFNRFGVGIVFALGGVLLLVAGVVLRSVSLHTVEKAHVKQKKVSYKQLSIVTLFVVGLLTGLFKATLLFAVPNRMTNILNVSNDDSLQAIMLLFSALASVPISIFINSIGTAKALRVGSIVSVSIIILTYLLSIPFVHYLLLILAGMIFSLLSISALSFVLSRFSKGQVGFAIGAYYGGVSATTALVNLLIFFYA
ncbi:MAG: MFS transporter [Thermonemataceae bacterium]